MHAWPCARRSQAASYLTTTSIRCAAPAADTLGIGAVRVTAVIDGGAALRSGVASVPEDAPTLLAYDASVLPRVSAVAPASGPLAGGTVLTVSGANLAPTPLLSCVLDELGAVPATLVSPTSLTCATPPAAQPSTTALSLTLDRAALSPTSLSFTYHQDDAPPAALAVGPRYVAASAGVMLTVIGSNLAPPPVACLFTLGGAAFATAATHVTVDSLECPAPRVPHHTVGTASVAVFAAGDARLDGQALLDAALAAAADPRRAPPYALSTATAPLTIYQPERPP